MFWDHRASGLPWAVLALLGLNALPSDNRGSALQRWCLWSVVAKRCHSVSRNHGQFVGHVAAEISGQPEFRWIPPFTQISPVPPSTVPFCPLHHFSRLSLQVNYVGFSDISNRSLNTLFWAILTSGKVETPFLRVLSLFLRNSLHGD